MLYLVNCKFYFIFYCFLSYHLSYSCHLAQLPRKISSSYSLFNESSLLVVHQLIVMYLKISRYSNDQSWSNKYVYCTICNLVLSVHSLIFKSIHIYGNYVIFTLSDMVDYYVRTIIIIYLIYICINATR
jgi:hypothetical protein